MHSLRSWREPLVTFAGMSITVWLVSLFSPTPGALVLAGVLAMTLSRNRLANTWRGRAEALVILPAIALVTAGVGYLLKNLPLAGAATFVIAMFMSIWLRRFGAVGARIGTLIALPFMTLLLVPGLGHGHSKVGPLLIALVALAVVVLLRLCVNWSGLLAAETPLDWDPMPKSTSTIRPIVSTRMALQMALALALAFGVGWIVFPAHFSWVVLTAFIVCSGNRGRVDVLYKSGLRLSGAVAGTVVATAMGALLPADALSGTSLTVIILVALGVGLWLRSWSYALWALIMTLVASLLQGVLTPGDHVTMSPLWDRVLAILAGAVCGLVSSWYLLPVRSEQVVRRRLADALAALSDFLADQSAEPRQRVDASLSRLNELAAPWIFWDRVARPRNSLRRPGKWILLANSSIELALLLRAAPGSLRRTLGETRKALRQPQEIGPALSSLHEAISAELNSELPQ